MIKFKIFGIDLAVSVGFVGVICLMLYVDRVGLMLPTMLAVTFHEIGHLISLLAFKSKPGRVELKIGAVAIVGNFVLTTKQQLIMLASGSLFNFLLFALFYCLYSFCRTMYWLNFSLVMLVVGALNLLPIMGLDGGDILNVILFKILNPKIASTVNFIISITNIFIIITFGFYVLKDTKTNISLIIFGIYLFLGILISKKQKNDCKILKNKVK